MIRIRMLSAEDGDCIYVETGPAAAPHRMLIDGGRSSTAPAIQELVASLPGKTLDLLVLTHVDADHIGGLLSIVESDDPLLVDEIWFNGVTHTRMAAGACHLKPTWPPPLEANGGTATLNSRQAVAFEQQVLARRWAWNRSFKGGPVMLASSGLPSLPLPCGGRIVLLGPPQPKLAAMRDDMVSEFERLFETAAPSLARAPPTAIGDVAALARQPTQSDRTVPNGASITFVLESGEHRVLFAADAHPGDLLDALSLYEPGPLRVHFDAIKLPHHGSARNNTAALIDRLESPLWLVSTNGSRHGHPDSPAMARVILAGSKCKTIVFSHHSPFNTIWADEALMLKHRYDVQFGKDVLLEDK